MQVAGLAVAQEREVALGHEGARQIVHALDPAHARLDAGQAGVGEPMPEEEPGDGQQVEVARDRRRHASVHPVARLQERPVEAAPVVRHEPCLRGQLSGDEPEERELVGVVGQEELGDPERLAVPAPQPDEEDDGARARGQPRRLGVQAHEWARRIDREGEAGQGDAVDRQRQGRLLDAHDEALGLLLDGTVEELGEPDCPLA